MKRLIIVLVFLLFCTSLISDNTGKYAEQYIEKYSSLAVSEMLRSGVPASITLAQGMLESACGRSRLAMEGKNHFGIKCHSDWKGATIKADDNAPGECFRKYRDPKDSFSDHSDFLRYKQRYSFLFDYQTDDYRSWAYGLKKAGYATDPAYPEKLIRLIEQYDLSRFDRLEAEDGAAVPATPMQLEQASRTVAQGKRGTYSVTLERELLSLNGISFINARRGESYRTIASVYGLYPRELARYNDCKDPDRLLSAGERVFLQKKAKYAVKGLEMHICSEGETLYDISQRYAVQLRSLMVLNAFKDSNVSMREDDTVLLRPAAKGK